MINSHTNRSPTLSILLTKSNEGGFGALRCYNSTLHGGYQTNLILNMAGANGTATTTDEEQLKYSFPSFLNEKIQNPLQGDNDINTERTQNKVTFLEEKLRKADELLRESAIEIKNIREERDKLRLDYDRLKLQMEQTQT